MSIQGEAGVKGEIKTQFSTIEGVYKLLPVPEYNRSSRVAYNNSGGCTSSPLVRISFICLPEEKIDDKINPEANCDGSNETSSDPSSKTTNICYNYGRDLYVYSYRGARKDKDLPKPIEKRSYSKEDIPTCHDFNLTTASDGRVSLLVGLLGGQIQLFDPILKDVNKTYNSGERLIDKSRVTCLRWIPDSTNQFLASHSSGQMYLYSDQLGCGIDRPNYQLFKQGEGYSVYTCKSKSTRNPLYRWSIGEGSINEFSFSPCYKYLATASQDGFLRVFNFDTMDLVGSARSYYGGLLCVCWSPDGKYVVTGGEDDLITIWSFNEKRVVCRGQGHMSWVTVVAFDPYTTIFADSASSSEKQAKVHGNQMSTVNPTHSNHDLMVADTLGMPVTSYRLGTVGQDTLLCLWDLKEDVLMQPYFRPRSSTLVSLSKSGCGNISTNNTKTNPKPAVTIENINHSYTSNSFSAKLANLNFTDKKEKIDRDQKRSLSLSTKNTLNKNSSSKNQVGNLTSKAVGSSIKHVGTQMCPNLDECTMLEPMVCKKIGIERLTGLVFREDCIVTSCQDGCILTWCRPGKQQVCNYEQGSMGSNAMNMAGSQNSSNGTVV